MDVMKFQHLPFIIPCYLYVQPQPLPALHHEGAGAGGEGGGEAEAPEHRALVLVPVLLAGGEEGEQRRAAGEHARPGD